MIGPREIVQYAPFNAEAPDDALSSPLTPSDEFYIRTNFGVPVVAEDHAIDVVTADGASQRVTIDALKSLGTVTIDATLECAGNSRVSMAPLPGGETWRGHALSTGRWTGVPLARVIDAYSLGSAGVREILFTAVDGGRVANGDEVKFQRALPLDVAQDDGPLLAFALNDAALTPEHGAPMRLVVPGWYAMASVKWIARIEATGTPFDGWFQRERYVFRHEGRDDVPVRAMRVKSMIVLPTDGATVRAGEPFTLRGWAWSGSGAIARVEVATSGDAPWCDAILGEPAGRWAWRPFTLELTLEAGHHIIRTRATDATGATQPDTPEWNVLGYGNNAVQSVSIIAT